ncbi:MAG: TolB family protein, partial [Flavobacteriales bacterium]
MSNVRQMTLGGNNAEAYWSPDNKKLVFQSDRKDWTQGCDQIFVMTIDERADSSKRQLISTAQGRTTCSFFMPNGKDILYASTHLENAN